MIDHPALSPADRTPSKAVSDAARQGLALREVHKRGGTEVGVRRAGQLIDGKPLSDRDIKSMYSYFARHAVDKDGRNWADPKNPSAGYIAWLLWGGEPARVWIESIRTTLREAGV